MKNLLRILFGIIMLGVCLTSWAQLALQNQFVGISGKMLKNVETRLAIRQSLAGEQLSIGDIKRLNDKAPQDISQALQPYGYFKVKVTSRLDQVGDQWHATYYINLGQPLRISRMDVKINGSAANDPKFRKLLSKLPLQAGDVFSVAKYKRLKRDLFNLAARRGYLNANMQNSAVKISLTRYTAVVIVHFDGGSRYLIGPISFATKGTFSKKFLNKFLAINTGEYYSSGQLHKTQENFKSSALFGNVEVKPKLKQAKNLQVPIIVHIVPQKSKQYKLGLGYGTDTGVRGSLGVNLYNLGANGQHVNGVVAAATHGQVGFVVHYIIPGKNPITDRYDLSVATKLEDDNVGQSSVIKLGPAYTTVFYGWQQIIRLSGQYEYWKFKDQDEFSDSILFLPSISWLKRKANDVTRPTRGYRLNVTAQGSVDGMISNVNFAQLIIDGKVMHPLRKGTILILRGTLGYTAIRDRDRDKLPLSLWFATGGAGDVRAYSYKAIGPGTELAVGSVELRQRLFGRFYIAAFYDAGNAGEDLFSKTDYGQGIGLGLVWLSPFGAIHLSFSAPTGEPVSKGKVQFSIGPDL